MFEGNLEEGELEIGQVAALFKKEQTVSEVMAELVADYRKALAGLNNEANLF